MVIGFRTAEATDGPLVGSLYSFSAKEQKSRRYKGEQGDSASNTLHPEYPVFFISPHLVEHIRQETKQKRAPILFWYNPERTPDVVHVFQTDGKMTEQPKNAKAILRFYDHNKQAYETNAYGMETTPRIGYTPFELIYTPLNDGSNKRGISTHRGHAIVELFADTASFENKIKTMGYPVTYDQKAGHLVRVLTSSRRQTPVAAAASPLPQQPSHYTKFDDAKNIAEALTEITRDSFPDHTWGVILDKGKIRLQLGNKKGIVSEQSSISDAQQKALYEACKKMGIIEQSVDPHHPTHLRWGYSLWYAPNRNVPTINVSEFKGPAQKDHLWLKQNEEVFRKELKASMQRITPSVTRPTQPAPTTPPPPVTTTQGPFEKDDFEKLKRIWAPVSPVSRLSNDGYQLLRDNKPVNMITKDRVDFHPDPEKRSNASYTAVCEQAREFWGGRMEVHGDSEHCMKMWAFAQIHGIKVMNFTPTGAQKKTARKLVSDLRKEMKEAALRPEATPNTVGRAPQPRG